MNPLLQTRVEAWIAADPDPATREELQALLAADDEAALHDRFDGRLVFGTAGIRGEVAAGPNRVNLAVVRQTAWGLAQVLLEGRATDTTRVTVVVGNDARPDSARFAAETAAVLAAAGIAVSCFEQPVPTPLVAFEARRRRTDAAVVCTASHNPRDDNGIKVYDDRGIQIIPPTDRHIAVAVELAPPALDIATAPDEITWLGGEVEAEYRRVLLSRLGPGERRRDLVIVATALHGVGAGPLERLLGEAGHEIHHVPQQRDPDGSFPTVPFPNPEEPGVLDLAMSLARDRGADLVLANDPDADRLAVALPDGDGGHVPLTGNELGVLLADALLEQGARSSRRVVASSIVSSPQLVAVAAMHDAEHRWTLTGFKWIWTALLDAAANGAEPVMGYEEALGYAVDPHVRDKDGLSAALAVVDLAAREAARGRTLADRLDDLAMATGLWISTQASARFDGDEAQAIMAHAMMQLRAEPPRDLAGLQLTSRTDHLEGALERPPWLGATDLLGHDLTGEVAGLGRVEGRVLVRPSGTEPKLKVYVDLHAQPFSRARPRAGAEALTNVAHAIGASLLERLGVS